MLKVRVRAAASEGEANAALIRLIAKTMGVAPRESTWWRAPPRGSSGCKSPVRARPLPRRWRKSPRSDNRSRPGTPQRVRILTCRRGGHDRTRSSTARRSRPTLRGKVADAVHRLVRDRGIVPGLAVVLVGNDPASESLRRQQDEDDDRQRHALVRSPAAGDDQRSRTADADRPAQRRSDRARHPGAASAARTYRQPERHRQHRSGQGRRRLPSGECRTAGRPACRR